MRSRRFALSQSSTGAVAASTGSRWFSWFGQDSKRSAFLEAAGDGGGAPTEPLIRAALAPGAEASVSVDAAGARCAVPVEHGYDCVDSTVSPS